MTQERPDGAQVEGPVSRALVVDDYAEVADVLSTALQEHGFKVTTATDFEEARTQLLSGDFDLLVTDVRLGPFNGLQLAVIARTKSATMRIVVMSGYDDVVLKAEALAVNAAYLVKPVHPEHLITTLQPVPEPDPT